MSAAIERLAAEGKAVEARACFISTALWAQDDRFVAQVLEGVADEKLAAGLAGLLAGRNPELEVKIGSVKRRAGSFTGTVEGEKPVTLAWSLKGTGNPGSWIVTDSGRVPPGPPSCCRNRKRGRSWTCGPESGLRS